MDLKILDKLMIDELWQDMICINSLLIEDKKEEATNTLIKVLDKLKGYKYPQIVNHYIRQLGLYPYMQEETSLFEDKLICNLFKMPISDTETKVLHREQSLLLKKLLDNQNLAISAPTSFGKSFIIDSIIHIKKPDTVVIIVPTIALMDETRRRLQRRFGEIYNIITSSNEQLSEKNILIFPQERALHYVNRLTSIDLLIVDEFYKASEFFDKERSDPLMSSIIKFQKFTKQFYFLAPNIEKIDFNDFEKLIPNLQFERLKSQTVYLNVKDYSNISKDNNRKKEKLIEILLEQKHTKTLIYGGRYSEISKLTDIIIDNNLYDSSGTTDIFSEWLVKNYGESKLVKLVQNRVGIHNGRQHRPLSQIQLALFEQKDDGLQTIISTSSIIEGVNTSAENVIVWSNKNGNPLLDYFSYKNLLGRCGRMFKYFIGNIYLLDKPIKHKDINLELPFSENVKIQSEEELKELNLLSGQSEQSKKSQTLIQTLIGKDNYKKIMKDNLLQFCNIELAIKIVENINENNKWYNHLKGLLGADHMWDCAIYDILKFFEKSTLKRDWDMCHRNIVELIKLLSHNWTQPLPKILQQICQQNIKMGDDLIDTEIYFKIEKNITFKLSSLFNDINVLFNMLSSKKVDITPFVSKLSHAFLPRNVYLLEEYGLPRMISRKIQDSKLIDLEEQISLKKCIDKFKAIGCKKLYNISNLDEFDKFVLQYFYNGI